MIVNFHVPEKKKETNKKKSTLTRPLQEMSSRRAEEKAKTKKEAKKEVKVVEAKAKISGVDRILLSSVFQENKTESLTEIQKMAYTAIKSGRDVFVKSSSGTGKTLGYVIPILDEILKITPKVDRKSGLFAMILVPTKELAKQIVDMLSKLTTHFVNVVCGGVYGCDKRKSEKGRLRKGLNVLVATPGRLHDHLVHSSNLNLERLKYLVVDEADLFFEMGYEKKLVELIGLLKKDVDSVQKIFVSATMASDRLDAFINKVFGRDVGDFLLVSSDENKEDKFDCKWQIKQKTVEVPTKMKLLSLFKLIEYNLLKKKGDKKIIVFFNSIASAEYIKILMEECIKKKLTKKKIETFLLHGSMETKDRMFVFKKFNDDDGFCKVLFTTDVSARGLNFSLVDSVMQYHPARELTEYIHRIGRLCRDSFNNPDTRGKAYLFLEVNENNDDELTYKDLLEEAISKFDESSSKSVSGAHKLSLNIEKYDNGKLFEEGEEAERELIRLHTHLKELVVGDGELLKKACTAFNSSIKAYCSYSKSLKSVFKVKNLHQGHLAESLCLKLSPGEISKINKGGKIEDVEQSRRAGKAVSEGGKLIRKNLVRMKMTNRGERAMKKTDTKKMYLSEFSSGL